MCRAEDCNRGLIDLVGDGERGRREDELTGGDGVSLRRLVLLEVGAPALSRSLLFKIAFLDKNRCPVNCLWFMRLAKRLLESLMWFLKGTWTRVQQTRLPSGKS